MDLTSCALTASGRSPTRSARSSSSMPSAAASSSSASMPSMTAWRTSSLSSTSTSPSTSGSTKFHTTSRCAGGSDSIRLAISAGCMAATMRAAPRHEPSRSAPRSAASRRSFVGVRVASMTRGVYGLDVTVKRLRRDRSVSSNGEARQRLANRSRPTSGDGGGLRAGEGGGARDGAHLAERVVADGDDGIGLREAFGDALGEIHRAVAAARCSRWRWSGSGGSRPGARGCAPRRTAGCRRAAAARCVAPRENG